LITELRMDMRSRAWSSERTTHYFRHSLNLDKSDLRAQGGLPLFRVAAGGGHAELGGAAGAAVDPGELVFGAGEADFEALGFAGPAFALGFGDAGEEVAADLGDAGPLGGIGPVQGAAQVPLTELTRARAWPSPGQLRVTG
jgi:hypothetical protein